MSATEHLPGHTGDELEVGPAQQQENERAERPVLHREFAADLTPGDGRTVDVRIIPYGERITHNDGLGGVPKGVAYEEEWVMGAFAHQAKAVGREREVLVNFEHGEGLPNIVGHGLALREASDGFYGSFQMHPDAAGDKALMMVREGILRTVSLEARPLKSIRSASGVVQRVKAHLVNIALTRFGAYKGAVVLAVREEPVLLDADLLPVDMDPELVERLQAQGVALPDRYKAHPVENGHPGEQTGTPEDGTGQDTEATTSED